MIDDKEESLEEKICNAVRRRLAIADSAYSGTRSNQLEDLKFYAGSPDNDYQWTKQALETRGRADGGATRPTLTINKLPQHVHQVTNDQKQNRPSGKVIPANDEADVKVAAILDGMVRHIQYMSDADVAYDTACENQVIHGEGYWRIITEYMDDNSFDQDIRIKRIKDTFSVFMDPMCEDPCGKDASWCIISTSVLKEEYQEKWPEASPVSSIKSMGLGDQHLAQWIGQETVRIVEYYYKEIEYEELRLYPGGNTAIEGSAADKVFRENYGKPLKTRNVEIPKIYWCKTNGYEILEKTEWVGKWIPVVRVVGNELEIEGELSVWGLIRNSKDAQRMFNYWSSQEAEMLALAPKSPFIGYSGQFEGHEEQWRTANTRNWPYLEANPITDEASGTVLPLPQRSTPPMAQMGLIQAKMGASDDIKSTTGQYDASLGQVSNERSGKAILARQKEGDTGTYHYVDNLARAIRHTTRIIVDLIPKIYDTKRIARIIGDDKAEIENIKIDPNQKEPVRSIVDQEGNEIDKIYNPGVGVYDVIVSTGPGYASKRQEALEAMAQILQTNPELWNAAGDLFAKNMDWPGAQEFAQRFRKMVPPELLGDDEQSPEAQALRKENEDLTNTVQQMQNMIENIQNSFEAREVEVKEREADIKERESGIKEYDAETDRIKVVQDGMTPEQIQQVVMETVQQIMSQPVNEQGNINGS